jgi:hypothetical protein
MRLFELWKGIPVRRVRDAQTSALYWLRLRILRLHDNWEKYTLDQRDHAVPPTNNGTERAIGKWRVRSHCTRGFKSWAGLEAAFLACAEENIWARETKQRATRLPAQAKIHPPGKLQCEIFNNLKK